MKKIGFIGLGNMATAIIGGMLKQNIISSNHVFGSDHNKASREKQKEKYGIFVSEDNKEIAKQVDILFLAVKPIFVSDVIEEIKNVISKDTIVVSIVAGKSISYFKESFENANLKIVRTMPNTPALVLEGCTGYCSSDQVSSEELAIVNKLLASFGRASQVPERLMDAVVGVSGSAPAYVFMFIEAMADAAVLAGMPRAQAYEFGAQAVMGSAKMVLETKMHPGELKDMVCSPGGTTIEAVKVLEEKGFRSAIIEAMGACIDKSKNL